METDGVIRRGQRCCRRGCRWSGGPWWLLMVLVDVDGDCAGASGDCDCVGGEGYRG